MGCEFGYEPSFLFKVQAIGVTVDPSSSAQCFHKSASTQNAGVADTGRSFEEMKYFKKIFEWLRANYFIRIISQTACLLLGLLISWFNARCIHLTVWRNNSWGNARPPVLKFSVCSPSSMIINSVVDVISPIVWHDLSQVRKTISAMYVFWECR